VGWVPVFVREGKPPLRGRRSGLAVCFLATAWGSEQAWHRRARRHRQQARVVLGVARARATVDGHHGGGSGMPTSSEKQFDQALNALVRIRDAQSQRPTQQRMHTKGGGKRGDSDSTAWHCPECAYFNFGDRQTCRQLSHAQADADPHHLDTTQRQEQQWQG
jgi:hypothetical protein